jgi:hypothetical protein
MINDEQLIFFIGTPGSSWSRIAWLLEYSPLFNINTSDKAPEREYILPYHADDTNRELILPHHHGTYWDAGMEFGNGFQSNVKYSRESFLEEVLQAWTEHDDRQYLIKSHNLGRDIPWIQKNFPKSRIIFTVRDLDKCYDWWIQAGGFGITYPKYDWFKADGRDWMTEFRSIDWHIKCFVDEYCTPPVYPSTKYMVDVLKLDISDDIIREHMGFARGQSYANPRGCAHEYPALISYYNCEDIFA